METMRGSSYFHAGLRFRMGIHFCKHGRINGHRGIKEITFSGGEREREREKELETCNFPLTHSRLFRREGARKHFFKWSWTERENHFIKQGQNLRGITFSCRVVFSREHGVGTPFQAGMALGFAFSSEWRRSSWTCWETSSH